MTGRRSLWGTIDTNRCAQVCSEDTLIKKWIKKLVLGDGRKGRKIPFGLYRGLTLSIDPAGDAAFFLGTYERETTAWLSQSKKHARTVIDVGTGCGELTAWALASSSIRHVVAVDASSHRWPIFWENMRLNGFANDGRLLTSAGTFLDDGDPLAIERTFENLPEPILLKLDIDGGEEEICRKMKAVLRKKNFLLLIETHSRGLDSACYAILSEAGYRVERIGRAWWRRFIPERRPLDFNQWLTAVPRR